MEKEKIKIGDEEIEIYYFSNPMFHEKWHEAENMGLEYVSYIHNGPDYWDDSLMFCKAADHEKVTKWQTENSWW